MQADETHYIDILNGLINRFRHLDLKIGAFTALHRRYSGRSVSAAPILFGPMLESLFNDIVLTIAKLYEKPNKRMADCHNIRKLLEVAEQNKPPIKWVGDPITIKEIRAHRAQIDSCEATIRNIQGRRDKDLAHYDKKYFKNPEKLIVDFPLEHQELIVVINVTGRILAAHSLAATKSWPIGFADLADIATEQMILALCAEEPNKVPNSGSLGPVE